jgi:AbrB family looped-hinge helix DNA binding protein
MTQSDAAEYTLKIAGKRQITLPKGIVDALNLKQGDELQIVMNSPTDIRLVPYIRVRQDLITPEVEEILRQRRAAIEAGAAMISQEELLRRAAIKNAAREQESNPLAAFEVEDKEEDEGLQNV